MGLAIASALMVRDELDNGQLQAPYSFLRDGSGYHLLSPQPLDDGSKRQRFAQWVGDECRACLAHLGLLQNDDPAPPSPPQPHVPGLAVLLPEAAQRVRVGPGWQQQVDGEGAHVRTARRAAGAGIEPGIAVGRHHFELTQDALLVQGLDQCQG
ncbi:hypothetical protein WR25_24094 [Diploscapter pachys]|uniref:Uncharacterized protein n=1 Tax=Diploscapter pachys TaxID=2018661 RepID=A0A2A2M469_9BILA|nr:hypothetical protein WR25_24094 [Diploscapter pachys]